MVVGAAQGGWKGENAHTLVAGNLADDWSGVGAAAAGEPNARMLNTRGVSSFND